MPHTLPARRGPLNGRQLPYLGSSLLIVEGPFPGFIHGPHVYLASKRGRAQRAYYWMGAARKIPCSA